MVMQRHLLPLVGNYILGDIAAPNKDGQVEAKGQTVKITNKNLVRGDIDKAEILLVEFSDYECFFCNKFHPTIKSIFDKSNGKIAWVYKHFPLEQIHPDAKEAAISAECVAKLSNKDNFWQYTDTLIANNKNFSSAFFESEAGKLGINISSFKTCLTDPSIANKINDDLAEGASLGVSGTPNTMIVKKDGDNYVILDSINGALDEKATQAIVDKYLVK
jgi:protein-disulfide isomerase